MGSVSQFVNREQLNLMPFHAHQSERRDKLQIQLFKSGDNIYEVILDEITFAWFIDIEVVIHVDGNETSRILLKLDAS